LKIRPDFVDRMVPWIRSEEFRDFNEIR